MATPPSGSVENWLDPANLRLNLVSVSLYIAAYELLKASIVERLKHFFSHPGSSAPDPDYATEVLSRNRSPLYASLAWLKDSKVIDDADMASFEKIKQLRNECAHAITRVLTDGLPGGFAERFGDMTSLLTKIERWWIINLDIATDPAFDGKEVDENEIMPGPVIALQIMMEVALGPESDATKYIDGLRRLRERGAL